MGSIPITPKKNRFRFHKTRFRMAVRGYEEEAMRPKSRAVEPNVEYCKPISNVATPSFKHGVRGRET